MKQLALLFFILLINLNSFAQRTFLILYQPLSHTSKMEVMITLQLHYVIILLKFQFVEYPLLYHLMLSLTTLMTIYIIFQMVAHSFFIISPCQNSSPSTILFISITPKLHLIDINPFCVSIQNIVNA